MDQKDDKKVRIFNSIHTSKKAKRKYFKVEKNRNNSSLIKDKEKEKELKKIFRTQKEYHILKRKTQRLLDPPSSNDNKSFGGTKNLEGGTGMLGEGGGGDTDKENSFLVLKIIPKKLILSKLNKKEIDINGNNMSINNNINMNNSIINNSNNNNICSNNNINFNYNNYFNSNNNNFNPIKKDENNNQELGNINNSNNYQLSIGTKNSEQSFSWAGIENEKSLNSNNINNINNSNNNHTNNIIISNNNKINNINDNKNNTFIENNNSNKNEYKTKLQLVYFYYIKNLCKYINQSFYDLFVVEQNLSPDSLLYQIYQSLQILDRKINKFKLIQINDFHRKKEEFLEIQSLKDNLLFMKNCLNNSMSQNLINIYIDIENFCKDFSN